MLRLWDTSTSAHVGAPLTGHGTQAVRGLCRCRGWFPPIGRGLAGHALARGEVQTTPRARVSRFGSRRVKLLVIDSKTAGRQLVTARANAIVSAHWPVSWIFVAG